MVSRYEQPRLSAPRQQVLPGSEVVDGVVRQSPGDRVHEVQTRVTTPELEPSALVRITHWHVLSLPSETVLELMRPVDVDRIIHDNVNTLNAF